MTALTKWPLLLVTGTPITPEQADEIIIRTTCWYFSSNDRWFERYVYGAAQIPLKTDAHGHETPDWKGLRQWGLEMGVLDLNYLHNEQIVSSWIGGPHGWCAWNGHIGTANYNIGKWPSTEEVTNDWTAIAEAFPYLTLTSQLITNEGEGVLAGQWDVHEGRCTYVPDPAERIDPQLPELSIEDAIRGLRDPRRERGVDLQRLIQALERVRQLRVLDERRKAETQ